MNSALQSNEPEATPYELLGDLAAQRRQAGRLASAVWFPLIVGGTVTMAAPTAEAIIGGDAAPAWYWGFAGPFIGLACSFFYGRRPVQMPGRIGRRAVLVAVAMVAVSLAVGITVGESGATPDVLVVGVGYACFAWLYRSVHVATVAVATLIGAGVLAASPSVNGERLVMLLIGGVGCAAGLAAVMQSERTRAVD